MNWVTALLNPKAAAPQYRPLAGARPRNNRARAAQAGKTDRVILAQENRGAVDYRVTGLPSAVTFEEPQAGCARQVPGVVLQRSTKWLQYTFDMWSLAGTCLYSIPIASVTPPEVVGIAGQAGQPLPTTRRKKRGSAADLAAHHARG